MVPAWIGDAACAGHPDPSLFDQTHPAAAVDALAVCDGCPVVERCASYAETIGADRGVWGGQVLTPTPPRRSPRRVEQVCVTCGARFYARTSVAKYCSRPCATAGYARARRARIA